MGCNGKRTLPSEPQVVQIGVARQTVKANPRPATTPVKVGDFHCGECGLSLRKRSEHYFHNCPGPRSIPYQESRREKCGNCQHNIDGICVEYKRIHPDRDAVVDVGICMAIAACPIGEWGKVQRDCPACTRTLFNVNNIHACHYCGWAEDSHSLSPASYR